MKSKKDVPPPKRRRAQAPNNEKGNHPGFRRLESGAKPRQTDWKWFDHDGFELMDEMALGYVQTNEYIIREVKARPASAKRPARSRPKSRPTPERTER